ncbi:MAG: hypothetical protein CMB45_05005 [Euryarchaeota archaeon]|nr:hypothetical protein [Euryarchaeota archaeon]
MSTLTKGKWQEITGLWERSSTTMKDQRTGKAEKMLYGKIRITEDIVLKAGDEVYVFPSRERRRTNGSASHYLKVKRPKDEELEASDES